MTERIARSVFWIVWSRGALQVLSFASALLVARLLSPADYGLMALAGIWTSTVSLVAELGLGAAIIQFPDPDDSEVNTCFWLTMTIAVAGYGALYFSAPAIAAWFGSPRLSGVLSVAGLTLPLAAVRLVPDSLLRKRLELHRVSQAEIASAVVTMPVVLGMAFGGAGVWALVAGELTMSLTQGLVSFWFVRWFPGLGVGGTRLRAILNYSFATLGARTCWSLYQQVDRFVLGKLSGDIVLGVYTMAKQLATLPAEKVTMAVNQVAAPLMAELQQNPEALRSSFAKTLRLVTCISWPLSIGLMLVAEDFIRVGLTHKWLAALPLLRIFCLYAVFASVAALFAPPLMARYRADIVFRYSSAQLLAMPIAFAVGAAWFGAFGVALAWVVAYPLGLAWIAGKTLREMNMSWNALFSQVRPAAVATALMALVVLTLQWSWTGSGTFTAGMRLVVTIVVAGVAYGAGLLSVGPAVGSEIAEVARWICIGRARAKA